MGTTRREFLCAGGSVAAALAVPTLAAEEAVSVPRTSLGIVEHSFSIRFPPARSRASGRSASDSLAFLDYCGGLAAGGLQWSIGTKAHADATHLRTRAEALGMYVEGSVRLPADRADTERFTAELRTAKDVGATVVRTAVLGGRRYETFKTAEAFREFSRKAFESLMLAEPIVGRLGLKLAVENHKDWRIDELVGMLKRLDSPHVGACLDTGNSIALLEDPMEVVEALAPWACSTHLKDMGVAEYAGGFFLAEVPLGGGFLDLPRIVSVIRKAQPHIRFSLEMITRDPLKVPCLSDEYWATFGAVPGRDLARTLSLVRSHVPRSPLPRISLLPSVEKLAAEEANVRLCLAYARESLGLAAGTHPPAKPTSH